MLAGAATVALLTACAQAPSGTATALGEQVESVVSSANAGDWDAARLALATLRDDVGDAQRLNAITPDRAAQVLAAADAVEAGLPAPGAEPAAPAPAPSATFAPTPEQSDEEDDEKDEEKRGKPDENDAKD